MGQMGFDEATACTAGVWLTAVMGTGQHVAAAWQSCMLCPLLKLLTAVLWMLGWPAAGHALLSVCVWLCATVCVWICATLFTAQELRMCTCGGTCEYHSSTLEEDWHALSEGQVIYLMGHTCMSHLCIDCKVR